MIEKKTRVSYSQYKMWLTCPKQWEYAYPKNLRTDKPGIEAIFGSAIHETIQEWLTLYYANEDHAKKLDISVILLDKLKKMFADTVTEVDGVKQFICDRATLEEYYYDGCEILYHVIKYRQQFFPTKKHKLIGCEVELSKPLKNDIHFIGYIDVVIYNEAEEIYHIYDLKTSRAGWTYQKKDPKRLHQVLLYKKFYSELFGVSPTQIEPAFLILKRKIPESSLYPILRISKFVPSHGKPSINQVEKSWQEFLDNCFNEAGEYTTDKIVATPSPSACKYCEFKPICPDANGKK